MLNTILSVLLITLGGIIIFYYVNSKEKEVNDEVNIVSNKNVEPEKQEIETTHIYVASQEPVFEEKPIEITNSVEPEIEYAVDDYTILDKSLFYRIDGSKDKTTMEHIVRGLFTTGEHAGIDYNAMNVHLVVTNIKTGEEVINTIQTYYNVVSPNSEYLFGFREVTDYCTDEFTFYCSITGYLEDKNI